MDEECFIIARRERAHKLMGDLRPTHPYPAKTKSRRQVTGAEQDHAEPCADQQAASVQADTSPESGGAEGPIEISDDDTDMESQGDDDSEGIDDEQGPAESPPSPHDAEHDPPPQPAAPRTEQASNIPQWSQAAPSQYSGHSFTIAPSIRNVFTRSYFGVGPNTREMPPGPTGAGQGHPIPSQQQQQRQPQNSHASPAVLAPFPSSSQGRVEPQQPCTPMTGHRPIAPRPVCTEPVFQPSVPSIPGVTIPSGEAEMMATYGLYPVPTSKTTTQRFQTPNGLVGTNGYEYLPLAWVRRSQLESPTAGAMAQQRQQQQQPPQAQTQSRSHLALNNTTPHGLPNPAITEIAMVPASPLPRSSNTTAKPRAVSRKDASTQTVGPDTVHPPSPSKSKVPSPPLNIPPEEATRHKASYEMVLKHQQAALECMQYLIARAEAKPLPETLTGLPPSLKDVEIAKVRLRESAEALLASLV